MTIQFDFITNDKFRSVLEADSTEMYTCAKVKAWKAVHILAGSIIEAVIIDYLIAEGHISDKKALNIRFDNAIKLATEKSILSEKVENLSIVVKDYRNLVHPGRSIRLEEIPDSKNSTIAISLVEMICDELSERKGSHGYTAAQIIGKVERDFHVTAILEDLITEMSKNEIKALLTKAIPETYINEIQSGGFDDGTRRHVLPTLKSLYRLAYEHAEEDTQREVCSNFVRILKEEDSDYVILYSETFWWADQLKHLEGNDAQVVKKHFFSRLKDKDNDPDFIGNLSGIGIYLNPHEVQKLTDMLVIVLCRQKRAKGAASRFLHDEHAIMNTKNAMTLMGRLESWQVHFNKTDRPDFASIVENERASILLEALPI